MRQIDKAIKAAQAQMAKLQSDLEALQQAATILAEGAETAAAAPPPEEELTPTPEQPKAKRQQRHRPWTAAEKKAIGRRMKKSWAKRRAAEGKRG